MNDARDFGGAIHRDLVGMVCGNRLGGGIARQVYAFLPNPKWVVKIEDGGGSFQNVMEWQIWERIQDTKWAKWFAPCHFISPNGAVLIQSRTKPLAGKPDKLPNFMTDLKEENFGRIGKQVVAHDYGYNLLMDRGIATGRLVKPRYWQES